MNRQSTNKITALYCRLASFNAEMDDLTARNQMERLSQYAEEHRLPNPVFFCDWGFRGTIQDRPEYQRMLREVEAGRVSDLVVVSLNRLGRDYTAVHELVDHTFPRCNVTFHSIQDNLPQQKFSGEMAAIFEALRGLFLEGLEGGRK